MKYAYKSLNHRSDCGALSPPAESFSTNFVRDAVTGLASVPDSEIIEAALKILSMRMSRGSLLSSPKAAREYLALRFGNVEQEVFSAIYLTKRHQVIACEELFRGTVDGASVHPRIVVKQALRHNAAAMLISHFVARHKMRVMLPRLFVSLSANSPDIVRFYPGVGHITVTVVDAAHSLSSTKGWLLCWSIIFHVLRRLIVFVLSGSERRSVGTQSGCQSDSSRALRR